jgi:DNA polymerase I
MKKNRTRDIVFDLESDGLLQQATRIWLIVTQSISTDEKVIFCDLPGNFPSGYKVEPMNKFREYVATARSLIGHNILTYDLPVLKKLLDLDVPRSVHKVDTLVMSQVLDYKRFGFGHGLALWGEFFKRQKPVHEDWTQFSDAMIHRCVEDVEISVLTFQYLKKELLENPHRERLKLGLKVEHQVSEFSGRASLHGFPFDKEAGEKLRGRLAALVKEYEDHLIPKLILKAKPVDGYQPDKNFKTPRWVASGDYNSFTAKWFGIDPKKGREEIPPILGPFCRVEFIWPDTVSPDTIKDYLYSIGWVPDDWNYKKDKDGNMIPMSPKITETSLAPLGYDGWLIGNLLTSKSRLAVLEGWLSGVTNKGRLHGDMFVIGTPTGRSVHNIIANIPQAAVEVFVSDGEEWVKDKTKKPDMEDPLPWLPFEVGPEGTVISVAEKPWGPQVRALFTAIPGYKLIGADSSGNQFRALCHYLGPEAEGYTKAALEGDVHQIHADILSEIVPGTKRGTAKPFFYAYIFGGGDGKAGLILTGRRDNVIGKKAKDRFASRIPGFRSLLDKLGNQFERTKQKFGKRKAHILAIDGRPIYCDSKHKLLNYLLQSCEKVTCAAAIGQTMTELDARGFDWQPCIVYHDELQFFVREDQAEEAAAIAARSFREAPKQFGVMIMDGESKIGNNWRDCH